MGSAHLTRPHKGLSAMITLNRRHFLRTATLGTATALAMPALIRTAQAMTSRKPKSG